MVEEGNVELLGEIPETVGLETGKNLVLFDGKGRHLLHRLKAVRPHLLRTKILVKSNVVMDKTITFFESADHHHLLAPLEHHSVFRDNGDLQLLIRPNPSIEFFQFVRFTNQISVVRIRQPFKPTG